MRRPSTGEPLSSEPTNFSKLNPLILTFSRANNDSGSHYGECPPLPTHPSPINHHQTAVKYIFNCQITYTCPGFAVKIFDNCLCTKIVKNLIVSLISFSDFLVFMFLFGVFSKCILRPQLLLAKVAL